MCLYSIWSKRTPSMIFQLLIIWWIMHLRLLIQKKQTPSCRNLPTRMLSIRSTCLPLVRQLQSHRCHSILRHNRPVYSLCNPDSSSHSGNQKLISFDGFIIRKIPKGFNRNRPFHRFRSKKNDPLKKCPGAAIASLVFFHDHECNFSGSCSAYNAVPNANSCHFGLIDSVAFVPAHSVICSYYMQLQILCSFRLLFRPCRLLCRCRHQSSLDGQFESSF